MNTEEPNQITPEERDGNIPPNTKRNVGISIAVVLALIFIGGMAYSLSKNKSSTLTNVVFASVTIISPEDGEQWMVGTKQIIKWNSFNIPKKAYIGIQLGNSNLDEDGFWESIATDLPNSGKYTWKVPETVKNGSYKIYIYTQGIGERLDVSDDALIHISGSTAVSPTISKISPSFGSLPPSVTTTVVNRNEVKEITISGSGFITKEDDSGSNDVYFSSGTAFALFGRLSPDGNTLTIPLRATLGAGKVTEDVTPGEYEIFIENVSGKSNSVIFVIEEPTTPSINVTRPKGGEVWKIGSTYSVQWEGKNIPVDGLRKISISLVNEETLSGKYIFESIINDGQENWTIPSDTTPGDYKLIIACSYPNLNDCPGGDKHDSFKIIQ